jgi:hypothetical protein
MAAAVGIKVPERGDGTPPPGEIREVEVWEGDSPRTKVEGGGGKDGDVPGEVVEKRRIPFMKLVHGVAVICM